MTAEHHNIQCRMWTTDVASHQSIVQLFVHGLGLYNKCVFDLLYCQIMASTARIDISVLRNMTSFSLTTLLNIIFLNLLVGFDWGGGRDYHNYNSNP